MVFAIIVIHYSRRMIYHGFSSENDAIADDKHKGDIIMEQARRPFPRVLRIEPASVCNLKCRHCPTGTVKMNRGVMPEDTFSLILEEVRRHIDSLKVVVMYHGGEPLLNKSFPAMVKNIKAIGEFHLKTVTNGMLLDLEMIEKIIECGLDEIEISLDGEGIEDNNWIRRGSDYYKVVNNIRALISSIEAKGLKRPVINIASTQFHKSTDTVKKQAAPADYLLQAFAPEMARGTINGIKATYAMKWPDMYLGPDFRELRVKQERSCYCDHVENTVTVRWNGDVVPCCYDLTSQCVMGNIHEKKLLEIWNAPRFNAHRAGIRSGNSPELCEYCGEVNSYILLASSNKEGI